MKGDSKKYVLATCWWIWMDKDTLEDLGADGMIILKYRVIKKDGLNFVRQYFLNYTRYVNDLHNIWKRKSSVFKYHRQSAHLAHRRAATSVESKMATMQHKNFCMYQRRTWDGFKRVLSVAHASQPVERAENLEYRNQLSGVCWGTVYCSIESIFWITLYTEKLYK